VGCRLDRMERTVLVHRKFGRGFALSLLGLLKNAALFPRGPPTDGRNVRTSRSTAQPRGVSATQWEDELGVLKPALHTAVPSLPRGLGPRLLMT
jgi:hypothetical protein